MGAQFSNSRKFEPEQAFKFWAAIVKLKILLSNWLYSYFYFKLHGKRALACWTMSKSHIQRDLTNLTQHCWRALPWRNQGVIYQNLDKIATLRCLIFTLHIMHVFNQKLTLFSFKQNFDWKQFSIESTFKLGIIS